DPAPWRAIAECDSVVVDPHKHGLQPYGCGAILFKDPEVGRFYLHDSPYTYFTSDELHLGEISLECSRAGAAAAALWLTFRLLPPAPDGLGRVLATCRRAALDWATLISESGRLELYEPPELDIVCYYPVTPGAALSEIDDASVLMLAKGMERDRQVFLSTLRVTSAGMSRRHPGIKADRDGARILRSGLMKPDARGYVPERPPPGERPAARRPRWGHCGGALGRGAARARGRGWAPRWRTGSSPRAPAWSWSAGGTGRSARSRRRWGSRRWPCPPTRRTAPPWRRWPARRPGGSAASTFWWRTRA